MHDKNTVDFILNVTQNDQNVWVWNAGHVTAVHCAAAEEAEDAAVNRSIYKRTYCMFYIYIFRCQ